ncbi:iron ABC transporter ATP-binding protein [Chromobacterium haemolyticum]|uniref:iron ABC transporter ATP-binding protein n=1 Tax=Chromobacterium haemolyticum TaxID=394935 RepID=UPI0009D9DAD7|nr:ATP-binding cassette domain-containing protein [Chromobacterium haemolyticum]OQS35943.1 iron ABC transporter ATP-binding protein [Chromobacterium haemolyticum]
MITLERVYKAYGDKQVLRDVNLSFPSRQVTSLIGPNGAGKSTLLMSIARLLKPSAGRILMDGEEIERIPLRSYAKRVATLRQHPNIGLRLTVEELVGFGRFPYSQGLLSQDDRRAVDEALAFLELEPLRARYLDELSGGQRQMAFLAMSIAQQSDYLLLDEPLNNLDMKHAVHIMQAIRRLSEEQGRTVILVVHDINFAANYSDHIVAMKAGAVHGCGPVAEVVTQARLRDLYGLAVDILPSERGFVCNYFNPSPTGETV